tara:strand:+ start:1409 stop:2191 length:783 start_codon:yes stop_codon:yes gene_type:complete
MTTKAMRIYPLTVLALLAMMMVLPATAHAAEGNTPLPQQYWPHKGFMGKYDKAALQRGFQVYREACASCHSLRLLAYRNLQDLGFTEAQVKAVASEATVMDGPNDEGDMFERAAAPADRFVSPFANDEQARFSNNGALPPDMSLLIKARHGGEDYIYALLTGYGAAPEDVDIPDGMHWNHYFPGNQIAMPQPLSDGQITYSSGRSASVESASRDVVQFLAWASEPHMEYRKTIGLKVLFFMLFFAGFAYAAKRRIWADVH